MGRWAPNELAFIERLEFGRGSESEATVKLVGLFQRRDVGGWPAIDKPMHRVTLLFDGVQRLELEGFGSLPVQVMGFDIRSVADRGWEGVNFEIEDYEDGRIHFLCGRVQILEVAEANIDELLD